ncbi:MAG: hypothetical protein KDJ16_05275 [Hyphomicrobiales bacterium]|nr:hypothetical protein [Hyphomicrobiales bacterium]
MSLSDTIRPLASHWSRLGRGVVLVGLLFVAGCTFQPLYGERIGGVSVRDDLAAISVEVQDTRLGQEIYNGLIFAFTGGGAPAPSRYYLDLTISRSLIDVGILQISGTPQTRTLKVNVTFRLVDQASGEEVFKGNAFADASFDRSNQRFANVRAERDAENRAAAVITADIRTRIAAFLATGG